MTSAAIIQRARLQVALDHATSVAGETKEMRACQLLIDKFPELTEADLVKLPWELQQVFRDALRDAGVEGHGALP
jgi:hypothetical protein